MVLSEQIYHRLALRDPGGQRYLHRGRQREMPGLTWEHNDVMTAFGSMLRSQLHRWTFRVRFDAGWVRRSSQNVYIADVMVIPTPYGESPRNRPDTLAVFDEPLPLVVEFWSPSTGAHDLDAMLPGYRRRGDAAIWRIHPYGRTLTAGQRQPDSTYKETTFRSGGLHPSPRPASPSTGTPSLSDPIGR